MGYGCVGVVEVGGCWGLSAHTSFEAEYPGGRRTCIMSNQQLIWRTTSSAPGLLRGMAHPMGAFLFILLVMLIRCRDFSGGLLVVFVSFCAPVVIRYSP